jgi:hypothetical protein
MLDSESECMAVSRNQIDQAEIGLRIYRDLSVL